MNYLLGASRDIAPGIRRSGVSAERYLAEDIGEKGSGTDVLRNQQSLERWGRFIGEVYMAAHWVGWSGSILGRI
jgi:hypothetical protein